MEDVLTITIPSELKDKVRQSAEAQDRSVSSWVRLAIIQALEDAVRPNGNTPKAG